MTVRWDVPFTPAHANCDPRCRVGPTCIWGGQRGLDRARVWPVTERVLPSCAGRGPQPERESPSCAWWLPMPERKTPSCERGRPPLERKSPSCARRTSLPERKHPSCESQRGHNSTKPFPPRAQTPHNSGIPFPAEARAPHNSAIPFPAQARAPHNSGFSFPSLAQLPHKSEKRPSPISRHPSASLTCRIIPPPPMRHPRACRRKPAETTDGPAFQVASRDESVGPPRYEASDGCAQQGRGIPP